GFWHRSGSVRRSPQTGWPQLLRPSTQGEGRRTTVSSQKCIKARAAPGVERGINHIAPAAPHQRHSVPPRTSQAEGPSTHVSYHYKKHKARPSPWAAGALSLLLSPPPP